jgi:predicted GTPase
VLSDRSVVGVLSANSKNDREVIDQINAQQQAFKDKVRQARLNRQLQQAPALNVSALTSQVNAQQVQVVQVGGTMTALPSGG